MAVAKYYPVDADHTVVYWTESWSMSDTEFARRVSELIGKRITASSISIAESNRDLDRVKRVSDSMVHIG